MAAEAFPHIYGPVPVSAVAAVLPIGRDADGRIVMPGLDGLDVPVDPPAH